MRRHQSELVDVSDKQQQTMMTALSCGPNLVASFSNSSSGNEKWKSTCDGQASHLEISVADFSQKLWSSHFTNENMICGK